MRCSMCVELTFAAEIIQPKPAAAVVLNIPRLGTLFKSVVNFDQEDACTSYFVQHTSLGTRSAHFATM